MKISPEFKIELKKVYNRYYHRRWSKNNKEKTRINNKKYRSKIENKDKKKINDKKYIKTPNGKKRKTLSSWKRIGLIEHNEELDKIYEIYITQLYCNSCNIKLSRNGKRCKTDVCMDHCHNTNKFRQIICRSCNSNDNWKKYVSFC